MATLGTLYNDPIGGVNSDIGSQFNVSYWDRKSIIDAKKEMFFSQLSKTKYMPKNYGKEMRAYFYVPLLDDRNINDQGIDATGATIVDGNLYGSSRDIGKISAKLPFLSETGGRVNRVGFKRTELKGNIINFGFFMEYSRDSLQFDTDSELYGHMTREMTTGAVQLTEAVIQKDILLAAGTIAYPGVATNDSEMTGEGTDISVVTFEDLSRLNKVLNDNRTPKQTTVITGSRLIDTKTVSGGRIAYCSSDVAQILRNMKNPFGKEAFIDVKHYADAGTILTGEIGSVGEFRFIEVPEMLHWAGAGADATDTDSLYSATDGKYDIHPILVVGDEAFVTIGFQGDGERSKFKTIVKKPGVETAEKNDPYGKMGFSSIQWWYGFMVIRPERIAVLKTVVPV